jgi:hypothetical protein
MLDLSLPGVASRRRPPLPPPSPQVAITAVFADGWSAQYAGTPPSLNPLTTETVSRQGFDAAGASTMHTDTLTITQRVREPYPAQGSLSAARVSLSDYVYSTDTIAGVTNSSAETSPKPVANWIMPHRLVVGNSVRLEVLAAHRNARAGRQVAAVKFIATDGTNTVSQTVAATVVSARAGDRNAVVCFQADLDITGLNAGLITCNAEVYPWIGAAASVAKSVDSSVSREFSPRYFLKNTGSKTYYYVKTAANGGNDATGAGSTNAATASGTPFLTVLAAINKAHTDLGAASGVDMAEIRIGDDGGTPFVLGSTAATRTQKVAALTITRDPTVARANARVSFGAAGFRPRLGGSLTSPVASSALRFSDIAIVRTGTSTFQGETAAPLELILEDIDFDNGSFSTTWLSASTTPAHDYMYGVTFANIATSPQPLNAGTSEHRIMRGVSATLTTTTGLEAFLLVGCSLSNAGAFAPGTRTTVGSLIAFNRFSNFNVSGAFVNYGTSSSTSNIGLLQNLFEYTSASSAATIGISHDNMTGSNTHMVIHNNTFVGFFINGRANLFYDEGTTPRTTRLQSLKGNIHVQLNTKGDRFALDGTRVGNWAYLYGVGCQGEFSQFVDADSGGIGSSFAQAYPGLGAKIGTSATVRNDPLFTDYKGTTSGPTAGAGGGTYTLQAGSPAKSMVASAVLSHDLAGAARPTGNDSAGAYA